MSKVVTLKRMRSDLSEWLPQGITEEIIPVDIDEYDRVLVITENSNREVVFEHLLEPYQPVDDDTLVIPDGIRDEELRAVVSQIIDLDDQIAFYGRLEENDQEMQK